MTLTDSIKYFFTDLNHSYLIVFVLVIYGIKYTTDFLWYDNIFSKNKIINSLRYWIAGLVIATLYIIFEFLDGRLKADYVSQILRTFIVTITINNTLIRIIEKGLSITEEDTDKPLKKDDDLL